jgi:transposase
VARKRAALAAGGRLSIPPERPLKSSLLINLYSVRSERAFCEQLLYDLVFRWFLDMGLIEPRFDPTVFTKRSCLVGHHRGMKISRAADDLEDVGLYG